MDFDLTLRSAVYRHIVATAQTPAVEEMAAALDVPVAAVAAGYRRLADSRMIVLTPDGAIRMALPFAGGETQHRVVALGRTYFANCAWDCLGIPAALHADAEVRSRCEQTHEPLHLALAGEAPPSSDWVFHSAVPAAHWWRDIVYT